MTEAEVMSGFIARRIAHSPLTAVLAAAIPAMSGQSAQNDTAQDDYTAGRRCVCRRLAKLRPGQPVILWE